MAAAQFSRCRSGVLLATFFAASQVVFAAAAELPAAEAGMYIGAKSCAGGNCHGKIVAEPRMHVQMNEHRIWSTESRHARAYQTLFSKKAERIAQSMGIDAAQTAGVCLDCHSNFVPQEQRGAGFRISEGVNCEACHGPASGWVRTHMQADHRHENSLASGMWAMEDPLTRGKLCTSCHVGDERRIASHRMMSAGHPRLIFDLDAFTANQPRHHTVDADYRERKPSPTGDTDESRLWLFGQIAAAGRYLEMIRSFADAKVGIWPELAVYDCHACHHRMNESGRLLPRGQAVGKLRLQDQHFIMLRAAAEVLSPTAAAELRNGIEQLMRAGQNDRAQTRAASRALSATIAALADSWRSQAIGVRDLQAIRAAIVAQVTAGRVTDYADAAQVYLGLESLSIHIGDLESKQAVLDRMFRQVAEDTGFNATQFREIVRAARSSFGE